MVLFYNIVHWASGFVTVTLKTGSHLTAQLIFNITCFAFFVLSRTSRTFFAFCRPKNGGKNNISQKTFFSNFAKIRFSGKQFSLSFCFWSKNSKLLFRKKQLYGNDSWIIFYDVGSAGKRIGLKIQKMSVFC